MNKIIYPLNAGMHGQAVVDLQQALLLLLEKMPAAFSITPPLTNVDPALDIPSLIQYLIKESEEELYSDENESVFLFLSNPVYFRVRILLISALRISRFLKM
jgi:hypothetical protein